MSTLTGSDFPRPQAKEDIFLPWYRWMNQGVNLESFTCKADSTADMNDDLDGGSNPMKSPELTDISI